MLLGFEAPNESRDLTGDEWARIDVLGSRAIKVRPSNLTPATLDGIRQRGMHVVLRPEADEGVTFLPGARYQELQAAIESVLPYTSALSVIVDNEPNHHNNHATPSPDYWARAWQVAEWLAHSYPDVRYVSPPLAVGANEQAWYAAGQGLITRFDAVGLHGYGQIDTGLLTHGLYLAKQIGLPIVCDEVGDSHPTAIWDAKGEALRVYLSLLRQGGVSVALLFHVGGTPDWANFVPPIDVVRRLAASMPQEVTMPIPTIIEAVSRPVAQQGGQVAFTFDAHGIDGIAKGFADVAYPVIPGSQTEERYGPNLTTELPTFGNGRHTVTLNVPPVATPTPGPVVGGITLRIVEMDGVTWDGGVFGPYPVDLVPGFVQPPVVTPEPPAPVPVALPPAYDIMWERAGDVVNAATAVGDEELAERGRDIHRTIVRRKEGR